MPNLKTRISNWILSHAGRTIRDNLYRGRSISNIVQMFGIGAIILLFEYWFLNYLLHWWNEALGQEVLALVIADLPAGIIVAGLVARRWRRTGSVEDVQYAEAERKYDHLELYFLKGEEAGTLKRYVVWNREGKTKGKVAWLARPWVKSLGVINIIHTTTEWDTIETVDGKEGLRDAFKETGVKLFGEPIVLQNKVAANEDLERDAKAKS